MAFDGRAAPARDAASVVLVRPGRTGMETFMLRRRRSMAFASGMHVFPGGGVEPSDEESGIEWLGPSPQRWGEVLGCDPDRARALVVAGARELFEETGVLLAGADESSVIGHVDSVMSLRRDVERQRLSFADLLEQRGLAVRSDLLAPWAHWITPEYEPRRFDTRFFVCVMPPGQQVGAVAAEADAAAWRPIAEAIEGARSGAVAMMAPTLHVCRQLSSVDVAELPRLGWSRTIAAIMPSAVNVNGRWHLDAPPPGEL